MIARPAGRYLGTAALLWALLILSWAVALPRDWPFLALLAVVGAMIAALAAFFRDPERTTGPDIVAPADGRVRAVDREAEVLRISIFMNVTDVHVNRFPLDATVDRIDDQGSGYRPAYEEDSRHNVRRHYHLTTALGGVEVIQMTGIVARRLVSYVRPGESHRKGERFGMIGLGSRVDVLLPVDRAAPVVRVGERVRAGETPIARELP